MGPTEGDIAGILAMWPMSRAGRRRHTCVGSFSPRGAQAQEWLEFSLEGRETVALLSLFFPGGPQRGGRQLVDSLDLGTAGLQLVPGVSVPELGDA